MSEDSIDRIVHVLPDHVANQIAAGEVVERPASVVKELVENSLDAGATRVRVEVEDGGKRLIRILDNGCGMSEVDALTSLRRHATSKVSSADDLRTIGTLGFRGEALPAIRSVSRFSIRTRRHVAPEAVLIVADGADEPDCRPVAGPPGTEIVVSDLFFNVPARRKFLRQTGTEMSRIRTFFEQIALGWPGVHFTLVHNGRTAANYPADRDVRARVLAVLGRKIAPQLHPVALELGHHHIVGVVSEPNLTRPNPRGMFTYINGRFVRDRVLQHAVTQAYSGLLERGRYPTCVLYITLPPEAVDVNVHPAKAEVRFVESGAVHSLVQRAIKLTLSDSPWLRAESRPCAPPADLDTSRPQNLSLFEEAEVAPMFRGAEPTPRPEPRIHTPEPHVHTPEPHVHTPPPVVHTSSGYFARMQFLATLHVRYLLCSTSDGLHVVDRRAAHAALLAEQLKVQLATGAAESQRLLFPSQASFEPHQAAAAEANGELLEQLGFECEPFGGSDHLIRRIPLLLRSRDPKATLAAVLDLLARGERSGVVAQIANAAAVRPGEPFDIDEVAALLRELDSVPSDRWSAFVRDIPTTELSRWFPSH